jgi:hypothetical protein
MSNTTISPNMQLIVPSPSVDPGPDWANNLNASLGIIDQHNHSPGSGVQITPAGLNISSDLPFNTNNATGLRSVRFNPQTVPLALASDIGCLYESGVDLWYNDGAGNQIRMTTLGSVNGSAGTITGLPSGTASATYSAGTFTFQSATLTPANFSVGPITIGQNVSGSKTITISPTTGQAANYNLFLPAASPAANQSLVSDGSGNLTWINAYSGSVPVGGIQAIAANLSGAYSLPATGTVDANGWMLCDGSAIPGGNTLSGSTPNLTGSVFLMGSSTAGSTGGSNDIVIAHTHGAGSYVTTANVSNGTLAATGGTAVLTGTKTFASYDHVHESPVFVAGSGPGYVLSLGQGATLQFGLGGVYNLNDVHQISTGTYGTSYTSVLTATPYSYSGDPATATVGISSTAAGLTGSISAGSSSVTGTSSSAGTGSDSRPNYISTVYLIRVK